MALIRSLVSYQVLYKFFKITMSIIAIAKILILYYPLSQMDLKQVNKIAQWRPILFIFLIMNTMISLHSRSLINLIRSHQKLSAFQIINLEITTLGYWNEMKCLVLLEFQGYSKCQSPDHLNSTKKTKSLFNFDG